MNNKKHFIKMIVYLVILGLTVTTGVFTGLFESAKEAFLGISFNGVAILRVVVMALLVMVVKSILAMILGVLPTKSSRGRTLRTIFLSMLQYVAIIVIICWGLRLFGVDVATIVASVGILALIVGFGAESLIEDVITGLFMLIENHYNVSDIIEINGFRGTVTSIGIRTTTLMDAGGNIKVINNSNMKEILNRSNIASRAIAEIGVSYEIDLEAFEEQIPEILEGIYNRHTDTMKSAPVYLGVSELASSAVILKFYVEVNESDIYAVQRILNHDLFIDFKKAGVEIPFTQIDVHQK